MKISQLKYDMSTIIKLSITQQWVGLMWHKHWTLYLVSAEMTEIGPIAIFTCITNLEHLTHAEFLLADGTFSVTPKHFLQLYTIHGYYGDRYVPLVYVVLPNKQERAYEQILDILTSLILKLALWMPLEQYCPLPPFAAVAFIWVRQCTLRSVTSVWHRHIKMMQKLGSGWSTSSDFHFYRRTKLAMHLLTSWLTLPRTRRAKPSLTICWTLMSLPPTL